MAEQQKTKMIPGYEFVVRGQYYSAKGRERKLKSFGPFTFFLPETVEVVTGRAIVTKKVDGKPVKSSEQIISKLNAVRCANHVIQRQLLPVKLAEKHPDATTFRTCRIISTKRVLRPETDFINLADRDVMAMSIPELKQFCKLKGLDVQPTAFSDVEDARLAVQDELMLIAMSATPEDAPAGDTTTEEPENAGITTSDGEVTSGDGVPVDEEDPAKNLI